MIDNDAEFLKRIRETFRLEAQEHLQTISVGLIELERGPDPERKAELIETLFRVTHSLKGAARSVDQRAIEALCQPMESAFASLKRGKIAFTRDMSDLFLQAVDHISQLMELGWDPLPAGENQARQELIRQLEAAAASEDQASSSQAAPEYSQAAPVFTAETAEPVGEAAQPAATAPEPVSEAHTPPPAPEASAPSPPPPPPHAHATAARRARPIRPASGGQRAHSHRQAGPAAAAGRGNDRGQIGGQPAGGRFARHPAKARHLGG